MNELETKMETSLLLLLLQQILSDLTKCEKSSSERNYKTVIIHIRISALAPSSRDIPFVVQRSERVSFTSHKKTTKKKNLWEKTKNTE